MEQLDWVPRQKKSTFYILLEKLGNIIEIMPSVRVAWIREETSTGVEDELLGHLLAWGRERQWGSITKKEENLDSIKLILVKQGIKMTDKQDFKLSLKYSL